MKKLTKQQEAAITADRAIIEKHGSAREFADLLGMEQPQGMWKVRKWMARGIPARVKLAYPKVFKGKK